MVCQDLNFHSNNLVMGLLLQHYVIKCVSDLKQVGGFLQVIQFLPPIKLTATISLKYIVESGARHHNHYPLNVSTFVILLQELNRLILILETVLL
jgi:hypothetical protein